jgi:hypothetical protein
MATGLIMPRARKLGDQQPIANEAHANDFTSSEGLG